MTKGLTVDMRTALAEQRAAVAQAWWRPLVVVLPLFALVWTNIRPGNDIGDAEFLGLSALYHLAWLGLEIAWAWFDRGTTNRAADWNATHPDATECGFSPYRPAWGRWWLRAIWATVAGSVSVLSATQSRWGAGGVAIAGIVACLASYRAQAQQSLAQLRVDETASGDRVLSARTEDIVSVGAMPGRCPRCEDTRLSGPGDCPSCGGHLWEPSDVEDLVRRLGFEGPAGLRELAAEFPGGKLGCPSCQGKMREISLKGERVDLCLQCGAMWTDAGEARAIRARVEGVRVPS